MDSIKNDMTKMRSWYAAIKFGLYRDYRIVRMADANGNKRDGIFIPFIQNGIYWKGVGDRNPAQYLKPIWIPKDGAKIHRLVPFVSAKYRQEMINEGVISPDDKYPCDPVGFIYRDIDKR